MLKNRVETIQQTVKQHYKKQGVYMKEAMNNLERRKKALNKLEEKVQEMQGTSPPNPSSSYSKIERFEEEFVKINRSYESPFHNFKHCTVSINPQNAEQVFENIGTIKNPIVASNSSHSYQFFNLNNLPIKKAYFFGDSNNQDLILLYDFEKDRWSK